MEFICGKGSEIRIVYEESLVSDIGRACLDISLDGGQDAITFEISFLCGSW